MSVDADVVILGGGCAGLSLAVALAQHAPRLSVVTLEDRTAYTRDRTWCFWNTTSNPFRAGITHQWNQWRVRAGGVEARQRSVEIAYQHLPAQNFYALAQEKIAAASQQLLLGTQAGRIAGTDGDFQVETSRGTLRSHFLFDARTPPQGERKPVLWQRFLGWHVETDRPCFDPECVDLMDFEAGSEAGRTVFFYVLPFSRTEALVEITYIDGADLPVEDGRPRLLQRMQELCPVGEYRILYEESGSLPMGQRKSPASVAGPVSAVRSAIALGTLGGRVKPSSGYAFQRIQRQSEMLARALGKASALPSRFEPPVYATLDRIFLRALERFPQRTPGYFLQLFRRVPPELLIPFLSETASARAIVSTMLALPKRDFIGAALLPGKKVAA